MTSTVFPISQLPLIVRVFNDPRMATSRFLAPAPDDTNHGRPLARALATPLCPSNPNPHSHTMWPGLVSRHRLTSPPFVGLSCLRGAKAFQPPKGNGRLYGG